MFRNTFAVMTLLWAVPVSSHAQSLNYEKYQLPNGLTVILNEDHSLPMACVNLWYHVGSKDEKERRSGFAHLFEHLMFMGTERAPGSDFDAIMEAGGGFNNASTSEDRTNYFELGPAELLPTLLWLEADRLESLGRMMTQEKLDKQRDVVRNERRQSYENRPYGKAELRIYDLMFPKGHPYHIPVIGTHADLEAATVRDVQEFFSTYYVPNNASMVVAGDFDPKVIKPLIEKLFASLPRGSNVDAVRADPVTLMEVRRVTLTDDVQFPKTYMVYHSAASYQWGDAEMELAGAILSSGISSRLYQRLIYEKPLASEVRASQSSMKLGSLFVIEATARPGVSLDDLEKGIDDAIAELAEKGPSQEELDRHRTQIEYSKLTSLESLLARADLLNNYEFHFGQPDSLQADLERYRKVVPLQVVAQVRRFLTKDARLILRVMPGAQQPEAETRDERPEAAAAKPPEASPRDEKTQGTAAKKPEPSARDERPRVAEAKSFTPTMPVTFKLSNGITVHHWERHELPLAAMTVLQPLGSASDAPKKAGVAALTADMLDEGAGSRNALEFSDALKWLGAEMEADVSPESTRIRLTTLSKNFGSAADLVADAILRPRFEEKEWQRVHSLHVQELKQRLDEPRYVGETVALRTYFGDSHPYSRPVDGAATTADAITLENVKSWHRDAYRPSTTAILVAGDLSSESAKAQLEKAFGGWKEPTDAAPQPPTFPTVGGDSFRVFVVDKPEAVQTVVRFVAPGPRYADSNRPRLDLLNTVLGGTFTSRLMQNLREKHGYTYGARSSFRMEPSAGYFSAGASVRADVTGASIGEFMKEFSGLRGGNLTAEEAAKARAARRMSMVQSFQGLSGILSAAATLVRNERPFDDLGKELDAVSRLSASDLNALAGEVAKTERGILVLVGDKAAVLSQLQGLSLPAAIELTPTGEAKK